MNNVVHVPKQSDLETFVDFLFEGLEGYVYVASKQPNHLPQCTDNKCHCWSQAFFEWPTQRNFMLQGITKLAPTEEIYVAPVIFKNKDATKPNVKASNVIWIDLDGNAPEEYDIPPSLVVQSSEAGHAHVYWKLDQPLFDSDRIEDFNRRLCFKYGADMSGWDSTQVLRPPYTINHKRGGLPVAIVWSLTDTTLAFNEAIFSDLAPAPEKTVDYSLWEKIDLPKLNDVIYQHRFGPDFKQVFEKSKEEVNDRSASLTHMAYICAEAGLGDREIYVIISHLADRWEKFKHHTPTSRARQLIGIIEHTRIKYPHTNYDGVDEVFEFNPLSLLETDIKVEWAIPGMLLKGGIMVMAGDPGVGKSQIAMQFMAHLAMGVPFLHYNIERPHKVRFFSLEMNQMELRIFMEAMYPIWVQKYPDKIHLLNDNFSILPFGEPLYLNTTSGQDVVIQYLEDGTQWDGLFIDSVGSAVLGNLNNNENVQPLLAFNDKIRKRYGCFLWYVHHHRKPAPGQKSSGDMSDSYGDQYIGARATSMYSIVPTKDGALKVRNTKNRLSIKEQDYRIARTEGLYFNDLGFMTDTPDPVKVNKVQAQLNTILGVEEPPVGNDPNPFKD